MKKHCPNCNKEVEVLMAYLDPSDQPESAVYSCKVCGKKLDRKPWTYKETRNNMAQHTPGPWYIHRSNLLTIQAGSPESEDITNTIAQMMYNMGNQVEANARLIAAAPELLEALQALVDAEWDNAEDLDWSGYCCPFCGHDYDDPDNPDCTNSDCPGVKACAAIAKATGE